MKKTHYPRKFTAVKKLGLAILSSALVLGMTGCAFFTTKQEEEDTEAETPIERPSYIGDISENTLQLSSNGTMIEISCEDYSDVNIDISGLEAYVNEEIEAFNKEHGVNKVSLLEYIEEDGLVRTAIHYSDINTYNEFNSLDVTLVLYDSDLADDVAKAEAEAKIKAKPVVTTEEVEIDEEALAEAGYSIEDIETGAVEESSGELATATDAVATLTDADGNVYESGDVSGNTYMMIKTDEDFVVEIDGGKVLYTNYHAERIDGSSARSMGDGEAIIVYEFQY